MKQMKRIEDVFTLAEQRRKAAEAKRIEKSGGFKFDQSLQIPMTFTFGSPTATPPQHPQPGHVQQTAQQSPPQQPAGFAFAPSGMANPFITPPHNNTVPPGGPTFCFPPRTTPWHCCARNDDRWERVLFWPLNSVVRHLTLFSQLYIHSLVHSNRHSMHQSTQLDRLNYSFTRSACIHLLNLSINIYQLCVQHSRLTHNSWFVLYCLIHTCCFLHHYWTEQFVTRSIFSFLCFCSQSFLLNAWGIAALHSTHSPVSFLCSCLVCSFLHYFKFNLLKCLYCSSFANDDFWSPIFLDLIIISNTHLFISTSRWFFFT